MKTLQLLIFLTTLSFTTNSQSFESRVIKDNLSGINRIKYNDFNNDGLNEYVVSKFSQNVVTLVYSSGTELIEKDLATVDGPSDLAIGDFDNNGELDIAISANNIAGIIILRNLGGLEFEAETLSTSDYGNAVTINAIDIDFDNDLDIVVTSTSRTDIAIFEMVDPSNFIFEVKELDNSVDIKDVNVADLNNDGLPDIVGSNYFGNELIIYFNQGSFNFQKNYYEVMGAFNNCISDFNNDGLLDIGVTTYAENKLIAFLNNGDDTFNKKLIDDSLQNAISIGCFDINLDDLADIVVGTDEGFVVYLMEDISNNILIRENYFNGGWVGSFDFTDFDSDQDVDVIAYSDALPGIVVYENLLTTLSVLELRSSPIVVFPNPATDMVNISADKQLNYMASIYSLDGRLIKKEANMKFIETEALGNGIFLIEVKDVETGKSIIEKLIIAK